MIRKATISDLPQQERKNLKKAQRSTSIDRLTGGKAMPEIAIESVDFRRAWDYVCNAKYDSLTDYLGEKVNSLISGGAEVVSLTAITMHMVWFLYGAINVKSFLVRNKSGDL